MSSRKMWFRAVLATCALIGLHFPVRADARDAARDLRRLNGYCIVDATTVAESLRSSSGDRYLRLSSGMTFKVQLMLLDPMTMSDVIVFAKPLPREIADRFKGKLPDEYLYSFKLLIDNEIFDAQPVNR